MNSFRRNVCVSNSLICLLLLLDIHEYSTVECIKLGKSVKLNKAEVNAAGKTLLISKEKIDKRLKDKETPRKTIRTLLLSAVCTACKKKNNTCLRRLACSSQPGI
ncbi:uncharacterized protein LOC123547829 [Mercenaria mercenaria]|uniref:uncharacterized protein LOC123547829 n=1 Tax=Mercenaria mercenaria TaxID=6596 RepID=UPI00234F8D17|nr:uncharacterized protein LOC123547829 [Mercenaria mercenaria]